MHPYHPHRIGLGCSPGLNSSFSALLLSKTGRALQVLHIFAKRSHHSVLYLRNKDQ